MPLDVEFDACRAAGLASLQEQGSVEAWLLRLILFPTANKSRCTKSDNQIANAALVCGFGNHAQMLSVPNFQLDASATRHTIPYFRLTT